MSTIPNKLMADLIPQTEKGLNLSIAATDTALRSQIENIDPVADVLDNSLKDKLLEDETTQNILEALANKGYQKKFKDQYPGINLIEIANAKKQSKYPLQTKKGSVPFFGINGINKILDHFDDSLQHQGIDTLVSKLGKEKIEFHIKDPDGNFTKVEEKDVKSFIINLRNCDQCKTVEELKKSGTSTGNLTKLYSENDVIKALKYADRFHTGTQYIGCTQ